MKMLLPILTAVEKAAQAGLKDVARATLKESNARIPRESGATAKSGFTASEDLTAQVGYRSKVAAIQHENLDYQHPQGGEAKFLERAAADVDVEGIMVARMKRELG